MNGLFMIMRHRSGKNAFLASKLRNISILTLTVKLVIFFFLSQRNHVKNTLNISSSLRLDVDVSSVALSVACRGLKKRK